jgi:hypothetical protein
MLGLGRNKYVSIKHTRISTFVSFSAFQVGPAKMEADASIGLTTSRLPSVILEVGNSKMLAQLRIDAKQWLEHMTAVSQYLSNSLFSLTRIALGRTGYPPFDR